MSEHVMTVDEVLKYLERTEREHCHCVCVALSELVHDEAAITAAQQATAPKWSDEELSRAHGYYIAEVERPEGLDTSLELVLVTEFCNSLTVWVRDNHYAHKQFAATVKRWCAAPTPPEGS